MFCSRVRASLVMPRRQKHLRQTCHPVRPTLRCWPNYRRLRRRRKPGRGRLFNNAPRRLRKSLPPDQCRCKAKCGSTLSRRSPRWKRHAAQRSSRAGLLIILLSTRWLPDRPVRWKSRPRKSESLRLPMSRIVLCRISLKICSKAGLDRVNRLLGYSTKLILR